MVWENMVQYLWVGKEESLKDSHEIKDRFAAVGYSIQIFHSIEIIEMYNYWCSMSLFVGRRLIFKIENN